MDQNKLRACFDGIAMTPQQKASAAARLADRCAERPHPLRRPRMRFAAALLAAGMLLGSGAMAAYFGLADKFERFSFAEAPLDVNMAAIIEQYGASVDKSIVIDGVTVTAEAYLTDKTNLHILYSLEYYDKDSKPTFDLLRDSLMVYFTDAEGRDLGHIVGGSHSFVLDPNPGKHYFTKTFALADMETLAAGAEITLRFTSDHYEATAFDLAAYLAEHPAQTCAPRDTTFYPVPITRNGITYTIQSIAASEEHGLLLCYTIDRTEDVPLDQTRLGFGSDRFWEGGSMPDNMTAFDRDGQKVYVRAFQLTQEEIADAKLYLSTQKDLTFAYTPNTTVTTYLADIDYDGGALSAAVNRGISDGLDPHDKLDGQFYVDTIEVTPLSITLSGTCLPSIGMQSGTSYGDIDRYAGMRFYVSGTDDADPSAIRIDQSSIAMLKDGTFTCTMLTAAPIDPELPLIIESADTGERFTLE